MKINGEHVNEGQINAKIGEMLLRGLDEAIMGIGNAVNETGGMGNSIVNNGIDMLHYAEELKKIAEGKDVE